MRCITIRQPWATLIAIQEKRFETRGWVTRYRGELAIHAGKQLDKAICQKEPIRSILAAYGLTIDGLPTGAFVAVCRLVACQPVLENDGETAILGHSERIITGQEYGFGDFATGRFAWELTEIRKLQEPVPAIGKQGLWNWDGKLLL
ncbi:2-oxoglutarate dehydrogenase E1 [Paenibacillus puldeungensis]|uniref:2-oxoglutarate dehydrogenase E1 n=1 Tax=Paenibacillus puldeungensis TaxID=696536 RepID=A0ABW3RSA3_9BACL